MRLCLCALGLCLASVVHAASGEEQIPVGPRALALGGAFTAIAEGTDAIYWNPAGLGRLRVSSIRFTNADLHGLGIQDNTVSLVSPVGTRFGTGIEWYHSGFHDGSIEDSLNRLSFALGWAPIARLSTGAALKYNQYSQIFEGVDQGRGSGWGLDLGLMFQVHRNVTSGVTWRDVGGTTLDFDGGNKSRPYDSELVVGIAGRPHRLVLLTADLGRDFHVGTELQIAKILTLRGGWSKDLEGLDDGRLAAGLAVRWGPAYVEYAYQDHPRLEGTHHVGAAIDFTLAPQLVQINNVEMDNLFASFYKSYAQEKPGHLIVTNLTDAPVEVEISVDQSEFFDKPTRRTLPLHPGVTQDLELALVFAPRVVDVGEMRPVAFDVAVTYQSAGRRRSEKRAVQTYLYERGTLNWSEGVGKAAAFVTPTHEMVHEFAREVIRATAPEDAKFLNRTTLNAIRLFDGMSACGLTYTPDPLKPYAEVRGKAYAVDNIQYPAELLVRRTGDCDDSTVLYASLLTNVGIPCAFVDVPAHIFVMFDTGIHVQEREVLGVDPTMFFEREKSLWIPVETTSLGQPFHVAWAKGAELIRAHEADEAFAVVDLLEASQRYEAAVAGARVAKGARAPHVNPAVVRDYVARDLSQLEEVRQAYIQRRYLEPLNDVNRVAQQIELSRIFFISRDYRRALDELDGIPAVAREAAYWNNLGDVQLALEQPQEALLSFERARSLDPGDPGIGLNLGLAQHLVGQSAKGQAEMARAVSGAGGVAAAMDLLGLRSSGVRPPVNREGEGIALQETSRRRIEALLQRALDSIPRTRDSRPAGSDSPASPDSVGVSPAGHGMPPEPLPTPDAEPAQLLKVPTIAGGHRGSGLEAADIVEVLYWKRL